jgi:transcriptional regulator with XRE-family HTH domain
LFSLAVTFQWSLSVMKELSKEEVEYAVGCLKNVAAKHGLNQPMLAEMSGVNQSTISKIFSGAAGATRDVLSKICRALGLKLADVLLHGNTECNQSLCGYLATPLSGLGPDREPQIEKIVGTIKSVAHATDPSIDIYWPGDYTHPTRNPAFTSQQVYLLDRCRVSTNDFMILFCAPPSLGVGQENEIAAQAGLPAIRIVPAQISRMLSGSFLQAYDVPFSGSFESSIQIDETKLRSALETIRPICFSHRALYKDLKGNSFGERLQKLIHERAGNYLRFAEEIGISLPYLHVLMDEQFVVSNPSALLLKRMAHKLCTSVGYLLGEIDEADPIYVESKASWSTWIANSPVEARDACALWEDWVREHHLQQNQPSTASFRKMTRPMNESDWQKRHENKTKKKAGASASGDLFQ